MKIFVVDDNRYRIIYGLQNGNFIGSMKKSELTLPNINKVANAFGITEYHINN